MYIDITTETKHVQCRQLPAVHVRSSNPSMIRTLGHVGFDRVQILRREHSTIPNQGRSPRWVGHDHQLAAKVSIAVPLGR